MDKELIIELYILKNNAVDHIKNHKYHSASIYLQDTLNKFQTIIQSSVQIQEKQLQKIIKQIKFSSHKNLSLCFLKMKKYRQCIQQCKKILQFQPNNIKIIYRIGKAHIELQEFIMAEDYFKRGFHIDPHQKQIMKQLQQLQKRKNNPKNHDLIKQTLLIDKIKTLIVFIIMIVPCFGMSLAQKIINLIGFQSYNRKTTKRQ